MSKSRVSASSGYLAPLRDVATVALIALLCMGVAAHFELSEALFRFTRQWEYLQLDELPFGVLVFAGCLVWLLWQRYKQAGDELRARQAAESRLVGVLAENRRLARGQLRVQEDERKNLARELHDELGQYLNAIKLGAAAIHDPAITDLEFIRKTALDIIGTTDHIHTVVSGMIRRLRPVGLDELGLTAALEHCVDHWRQRRPETQVTLSVSGDLDRLDEAVSLAIYRITQEGLTNTYKHANARHVDVVLERSAATEGNADILRLSITDDGCGMQPGAPHAGYGLTGIRERVETIGGHFALESAPGAGVTLKAHLPLGAAQ